MLLKKPRHIAFALAGLAVVVAAIIVWIKWKDSDSDLLDYRKHFTNRAAMTRSGCFVIAPKPATRPNGTLYFLHNDVKKSSSSISSWSRPELFQIMKFSFEDWKLSKIADLPAQPAYSTILLYSADSVGENLYAFSRLK
ncbi:MAG: hypothetical protein NTX50_02795 [Candidatus Sumerlaeota bacterium]|nr:hypothetical protein [Candidatus Sumerlaeota bacterium]